MSEAYGRPLRDHTAQAILAEIESWQGQIPYQVTPLALRNLHRYINELEDGIDMLRKRLTQLGTHHKVQETTDGSTASSSH